MRGIPAPEANAELRTNVDVSCLRLVFRNLLHLVTASIITLKSHFYLQKQSYVILPLVEQNLLPCYIPLLLILGTFFIYWIIVFTRASTHLMSEVLFCPF